jgi:hypothetical protein
MSVLDRDRLLPILVFNRDRLSLILARDRIKKAEPKPRSDN